MIERQSAVALIMYLQRAHSIIPTTGTEYSALQPLVSILEKIANGQAQYGEVAGDPNGRGPGPQLQP